MDSIPGKNSSYSATCPICNKKLVQGSFYCGSCGSTLSTDEKQNLNKSNQTVAYSVKTPWHIISPAIKLWVLLLFVNGLVGITIHFIGKSSPIYDLYATVISGIIILFACIEGRKQIKPLLEKHGEKWYFHIIDVIASVVLISGFMWLYQKGAALLGLTPVGLLKDYKNDNWPIWSAYILISFCPAIFEELAFRGYIMSKIEMVGSQKEAVMVQASMFSILHLLPANFISHFFIGLILGVIRMKSKSLYPGMILHAFWNAIVITNELLIQT